MSFNSLRRSASHVSAAAGARPRHKPFRPTLELLEDRLTPAFLTHGIIGGNPINFTDSYGGGPVLNTASGPLQVDLVFWGTAFAKGTQAKAPLITAVQNLFNSPFLSALSQYDQVSGQTLPDKAGDVVLAGSQTVTSDPGSFNSTDNAFDFSDTDVQTMLDNNIGGVIPSPPPTAKGLPSSNFLYLVITESNSEDTTDGAFGIHGIDPANTPQFYYGWTINDGTLPTVMSTLAHELVEAITDPDTSGAPHTGGFSLVSPPSQAGNEFCDGLGQDFLANLNGVDVQAYFSRADKAYVIPTGGQEDIFYSTKGVLTVLGGQLGLPTDNITISLGSTGGIEVQENGDTFLFDSTAAVESNSGQPITSIVVNGEKGNTDLTLDFSNGNFIPANGLAFVGGTEGHNTLQITGTGEGLMDTWTVSGVNKGTVNGHIAFSNVSNLVGDTTVTANIFKFVSNGSLTGTIKWRKRDRQLAGLFQRDRPGEGEPVSDDFPEPGRGQRIACERRARQRHQQYPERSRQFHWPGHLDRQYTRQCAGRPRHRQHPAFDRRPQHPDRRQRFQYLDRWHARSPDRWPHPL